MTEQEKEQLITEYGLKCIQYCEKILYPLVHYFDFSLLDIKRIENDEDVLVSYGYNNQNIISIHFCYENENHHVRCYFHKVFFFDDYKLRNEVMNLLANNFT